MGLKVSRASWSMVSWLLIAPLLSGAPALYAAPPVANAGEDLTVPQSAAAGAAIALDGSGSTSTDGRSLTGTWYGPFGAIEGLQATAPLPEGRHAVNLVVDDGQQSAPDVLDVDVQNCFLLTARPKRGKVQLTWSHQSVPSYDVYRANADNPVFAPIGTTTSTYSTYLDQSVDTGLTYLYAVSTAQTPGACFSAIAAAHPSTARRPGNQPPVIYSTPVTQGWSGLVYTYDVAAADPNSGAVTYTLITAPSDMVIDPASGRIAWTPASAGSAAVVVSAVDQNGAADSQSFTVSVEEIAVPNSPPVANAGADQTVDAGTAVQLDGSASMDPDGDTLTYLWTLSPPAGSAATLSAATSDMPGFFADVPGLYTASLIVDDGVDASLADTVNVTANEVVVNEPPEAADDRYTGRVGEPLTIDAPGVLANDTDPNGDPLSVALISPPAKGTVAINGDGSFTYTSNVIGTGPARSVNLTLGKPPEVRSSSAFSGFPAARTIDDDLNTSWFSARPPAAEEWVEQEWAEDVTAREVHIFGNRQFASGFDFTQGFIQLFDAAGTVLYDSGLLDFPAPTRDLVVDVGEIANVRRLRFTGTATESGRESGISEMYLIGDGRTEFIGAEPAWRLTGATDPFGNAVGMRLSTTPAVIDLDGDGSAETIFAASSGHLVVLNGDGSVHFIVGGPSDPSRRVQVFGNPAVGDIDGDGSPEIVIAAVQSSRILAFENDGTLKWTSASMPINVGLGAIALADLNADGAPEIIAGSLTADTGVTVLDADGGLFWSASGGSGNNYYQGGAPIVADVDLDGVPEVLAGNTAYNADGTIKWFRDDLGDGFTAVANFDTDPQAEIVLVTLGRVYLLEHDGTTKGQAATATTGGGGAPTVADFDNDGAPEIGVAGASFYRVYDTDLSTLWSTPTVDASSSRTGSSVFDFENDGQAEVVYRDEFNFYVFAGADGSVRFETPLRSSTGIETPVVADINGDGTAEILVTSDVTAGGNVPGLYAFTSNSAQNVWADTRALWNQYSYHVTNINDDGTIPANEPENWLVDGLNHFRKNDPLTAFRGQRDSFAYVANDGQADSNTATVAIDLLPANSAPVITSTPVINVEEGEVYLYDVSATDADEDVLTYALSQSPDDMAIDAVTGVVSWNPGASDLGEYPVTVIVTDDDGFTDLQTWTLVVAVSTNTPPTANAGGDQTLEVGVLSVLDGSASSDPDGDALTYAWTLSAPVGSSAVLQAPGTVNPRFVPDVPGTYTLELVVNDGRADSLSDTVFVTANEVNVAPVLAPIDDVIIEAGTTLNVNATATDANGGDTLTFSLAAAPAGMTIDSVSGAISWEADTTGPQTVTVEVRDAGGLTDTTSFSVTVEPAFEPPVEIVVTFETSTLVVGEVVALSAVGILSDGTSEDLTDTVIWSTGSNTFVADSAGQFTVEATVGGVTGSVTFTVIEAVPGDASGPTSILTTPTRGAAVTAPVDVVGTAADDNFVRYTLSLASANEGTFTVIDEGTQPVNDGVLGTLDPTQLLNGQYLLRLTVYDAGGNAVFVERPVIVEEDFKVGIFSLDFTDLVIPMSGIPITVTRSYDTRDKGTGAFGVGWRLDVNTMRVEANRDLGTAWEVVDTGLLSVALVETDDHLVSLTLPGGRVEKFRMRPNPDTAAFAFSGALEISFEPEAGTLGQLESLDNNFVGVLGSQPGIVTLLDDEEVSSYNPQRFRYTAADGTAVVLNRTDGVERITEPGGNTLTFGPNGIIHSAGRSVTFTRDAEDRIVAITAPSGATQNYLYDGNGDLVAHTDAGGFTTRYAYNRFHDLLSVTDPLNRVLMRNEYDEDARLISITNTDGNITRFARDLSARREIVTDATGASAVLSYDAQGNVLSVTDALGNTTTNSYDAAGNQLTTTNPLGETTTRTYDDRNNVLSETNPAGETRTFTYDAGDRVTSITDPLGRVTTYAYGASGRLTQKTDAIGAVVDALTYDGAGNLQTRTNGRGHTVAFEYDAFGNQTALIDAEGNRLEDAYDADGNLISETDARGNTVITALDARGLITGKTDALGNTSTFVFNTAGILTSAASATGTKSSRVVDANGKDLETVDALGNSTSRAYDVLGNLIGITSASGATVTYEYDALSRRIATINPDGGRTEAAYDAAGRIIRETDPRGNASTFTYDAAGRNVSRTDPLGQTTTFSYDAAGNRVGIVDAAGNTFATEYDALNRAVRSIFPDGTSSSRSYDAAGNLTTVTDALGQTTTYTYDANDNLAGVTAPDGTTTTYTYDADDNLLTQTDALGRTTTFTYDANGRPTGKIYPDGTAEVWRYNAEGLVDRITDPSGDIRLPEHDAAGQLTRTVFADGSQETHTYSATGQRLTSTNAEGTVIYTYDTSERLQRVTYPDGSTVTYTYDASDNRTSVTSGVLAGPGETTRYTYDALDRLQSVIEPDGDTTTYAYDAIGNLATKTHPNGVVSSFTYDSLSRLAVLTHARNGSVLAEYRYTVNAMGDRTRVDHADGSRVEYAYDARRRLTRETHLDSLGIAKFDRTYVYDAVGNRSSTLDLNGISVAYTYNVNDQLQSAGSTSFAYDDKGNLQSRTDATGTADYTFDEENQLVSVATPVTSIAYAYDADGTRLRETVDGVETRFLVDPENETGYSQVVADYDNTGAPLASYTYGTERLAQNRGGVEHQHHSDGSHNLRVLTDSSGSVSASYDYDGYGRVISTSGSTQNPYGFASERMTADGMYYLRARYYDPESGRFVSRDPFAGTLRDPDSLHRYLYAHANPIVNRDPSGQKSLLNVAATLVIIDVAIDIAVNVHRGASPGKIVGSAVFTGLLSAATGSATFAKLIGKGAAFLGSKFITHVIGKTGVRILIASMQAMADTVAWAVGTLASPTSPSDPNAGDLAKQMLSVFVGNFLLRQFPVGKLFKDVEEKVVAEIAGPGAEIISKSGSLLSDIAQGGRLFLSGATNLDITRVFTEAAAARSPLAGYVPSLQLLFNNFAIRVITFFT